MLGVQCDIKVKFKTPETFIVWLYVDLKTHFLNDVNYSVKEM